MAYLGKVPALVPIDATDIPANSIDASKIIDGSIEAADITAGSITVDKLNATLDLSSKTVTLPASSVTAHATTPTLDSPSITGTLSIDSGGTVSHTISNWSDDVTYVVTPTNCTIGAINSSGVFVVTHTSGTPSYTIKATTDSLGLADSSVVTKNIVMNLSAPTLSSPADVATATDVVYTITSTDSNDDKIILDIGSSNFTYSSVSVGTASKVGNTVECIGFTTNNPAVTIQFTAEATYSVTAKSVNIAGTYGDSASSSADSITIAPLFVAATGGTVTTDGDYKVHTFTSSGTLSVVNGGDADYVIIAGGGGGGAHVAGGAGAGGFRSFTSQSLSAQNYTVTIGAGGAGTSSESTAGSSGADSSFNSHTSSGGGGGIGNAGTAGSGGSGGSSGMYGGSGGSGNSPSTSPAQGTDGRGSSGAWSGGSGGGGASAQGSTGANGNRAGGVGGAGTATSISGSSVYYAGGGGGGSGFDRGDSANDGGIGGGGRGGRGQAAAFDGTTNTGGGGGGGLQGASGGGSGGSGRVIIRYQYQ